MIVECVMKMKRLSPGKYESHCGRVLIERIISHNFRCANDVVWQITVDGVTDAMCEMTKRDALESASYKLSKMNAGGHDGSSLSHKS